jgi:hypothetical protein
MIDLLFPIVLSEAVLGGGGRTFAIGPISLRMVLFAVSVVTWITIMLASTRRRDGVGLATLLIAAFVAGLTPGLLVDVERGTNLTTMGAELQPLLFWLIAPLFAMALHDVAAVRKAANILMYGGVAVGAVTLLIMLGLQLGVVNFGRFYAWASDTNELFFRTRTSFFYKGHFYVGIGFIFCLVLLPRWWKTMFAIAALSIGLSLTRGLYLAIVIATVLSFVSARRSFAVIAIGLAGIAVAVFYGDALLNLLYDPSRLISSQTRSRDFTYFMVTFDYDTLLFGDGTGVLLNGRHSIENSYIWAMWRFGIGGLLFWLTPLILSTRYFLSIRRDSEVHQLASAFFFGMIMLYVLTFTNPFINNSIGMAYALCTIFALRRLSLSAISRSTDPVHAGRA